MGRLIRRYIRAYKLNVAGGGIHVDAGLTVPIFMKVGAYAADASDYITWDGAAGFIQIWIQTSDTTPECPVFSIRYRGTGVTTSDQILAMEIQARTSGTAVCRGIEAHAVWLAGATVRAGSSAGIYIRAEISATVTVTGDVYGAYIYIRSQSATTGGFYALRIECNSSTKTWDDAWIQFVGDPNYAFNVSCGGTASSASGTPSTMAGWMKVNAGGADRWIALYSTSP